MHVFFIIIDEMILFLTDVFGEPIKFKKCAHLAFDSNMSTTEINDHIWKCVNHFANVKMLVLLTRQHVCMYIRIFIHLYQEELDTFQCICPYTKIIL